MIDDTATQTNNSSIEKYCYADTQPTALPMALFTNGTKPCNIQPQKAHRISVRLTLKFLVNNDWKILEMQLGMTQAQADGAGWRGTDQGTQLKDSGSSGLDILLIGTRDTNGSFANSTSYSYLWSSSESSTSA